MTISQDDIFEILFPVIDGSALDSKAGDIDSDGEIWSYMESENSGKLIGMKSTETQKTPVGQGNLAEREGFEPSIEVTPYAGLASRPGKPTTSKRVMGCTKQKTPLSCELTVSHDKPVINPSTDNPPALSPDLAGIVAAWSSIPDQIKAAVKAVLAPYLTHEAEKEGGK